MSDLFSLASLPEEAVQLAFSGRSAIAGAFHSDPIVISNGVEILGLGVEEDFIVILASPLALAGFNRHYMIHMSNQGNQGHIPPDDARIVKFARRGSCGTAMFDPSLWSLSNKASMWAFKNELEYALADHALTFDTTQYLFCPTSNKLRALYRRMARNFESGKLGVKFKLLYEPESENGNYCYARIESQ